MKRLQINVAIYKENEKLGNKKISVGEKISR